MVDFIDVVARRGHTQVLRGVSLTVAPGEVVALVGRSGSGKTTMLRLVNRMLTASGGEVHVDGRPVSAWDPITLRRQTGYAVQDVGLFPGIKIENNGIRRLRGSGPGQGHMQFNRRKVLYPNERLQIIYEADCHLFFIMADLRSFYPGGTMRGTALLKKEILCRTIRIAL